MKNNDKMHMISLLIFIISIFAIQGFNKGIEFVKNIVLVFKGMLILFNQTLVKLTGNTIFDLLFSTAIIFCIVGFLLKFFKMPKDFFGKCFGKVAFWLLGFPVTFVMNFMCRMIFCS